MKIRRKKKKTADCREQKERIVPFLKNELDAETTRDFLQHLETCSECREEMKIQYMVREGLVRLEKGRSFDFRREYEARMQRERQQNARICFLLKCSAVAELVCTVITVAFLTISLF